MSLGFSGEPLTRWDGIRNMVLEEDFFFIDSKGKRWEAPKGSCLNGATIPKALWTIIGAPYCGQYRRASVVHDVGVGELCNPEVSYKDRKKADRMFYEACLFDGCSKSFALVLYIGVRFGTWSSVLNSIFEKSNRLEDYELKEFSPEDEYLKSKFWSIIHSVENEFDKNEIIDSDGLDKIDLIIESEMGN